MSSYVLFFTTHGQKQRFKPICIIIPQFFKKYNENSRQTEKICICTENGASSVLVADHNKIWQARKAFAEAVRAESLIVCKEDVVVPVDQEAALLDEILRLAKKYNLVTRIASHAGDGNIHLDVLRKGFADEGDEKQKVAAFEDKACQAAYELGGAISGEHGIGQARKALFAKYTDPVELALMKAVKQAWDPKNILNPGKIFD